jgi:hypothetical protein
VYLRCYECGCVLPLDQLADRERASIRDVTDDPR